MAFRALLFSKGPETNAAMTAACKSAEISVAACSDIFTAIEKGKTQAFSCVIADWADQPEASFLLKRARESTPNQNTVAIAIVDHDPTPAELRDNRLDFLVYRPISAQEAAGASNGAVSSVADAPEQSQQVQSSDSAEASGADSNFNDVGEIATATAEDEVEHRQRGHAIGFREVCAAVLVLTAAFCLWRSRDVIEYLSRTPEGRVRVLRESVAALFYMNQAGALPVSSVGSDAQQDAYYSRGPATSSSNAQTPSLGVVATEST